MSGTTGQIRLLCSVPREHRPRDITFLDAKADHEDGKAVQVGRSRAKPASKVATLRFYPIKTSLATQTLEEQRVSVTRSLKRRALD